jgi:AraC-like DNA-binding protein
LESPLEDGVAYHVVVNALEGRAGWTPMSRFASAVRHAVAGHVPYRRYWEAGRARKREGAGEGEIERAVGEWLASDLNPAIHFMRGMRKSSSALSFYNAYNESAHLGVKTSAAPSPHGADSTRIVVSREKRGEFEDLEPCRLGTIAVLTVQIASARAAEAAGRAPKPESLSGVAELLGVAGSAAAEAALVFEAEGHLSIVELAARLGCHQRTLERRLRKEGITAEGLRLAWRMVAATDRLRSAASLTEIAFEMGFSDLAHMTRAFRSSCGMAPSQLRRLALMDMAGGA